MWSAWLLDFLQLLYWNPLNKRALALAQVTVSLSDHLTQENKEVLQQRNTITPWSQRESKAVRGSSAQEKAEGSEPPSTSPWVSSCSPVRRIHTCWQWMREEDTASSASPGNLKALKFLCSCSCLQIVLNGRSVDPVSVWLSPQKGRAVQMWKV